VLAEEGAPRIIPFGVKMVGPVIYTFGSDEQKERFLPGIRSSEVQWCQAIPSRAPARTSPTCAPARCAKRTTVASTTSSTARRPGPRSPTWADWIFCLVRTDTDAKPQEGISFLLIDMKTPGITVRPIVMLDGAHHVNDVFFDNVKVPVANLVGKENEGWTCAKFLLANERLGIAEVPGSKRGVRALWELNDDPSLKEKIADVDLQVQALEMSELRALATMQLGGAPGPEASILKVRGSEIQQRIAELAMEAVGEYAAPYQPDMLVPRHQRDAGRAGPRTARRAALFQHAQDHDLRRQHRDSEEHRVESDPGVIKSSVSPRAKARGLSGAGRIPRCARDDNEFGGT
jgi:alkylation response protein AidB-like acyl-CoA dehydrogenase